MRNKCSTIFGKAVLLIAYLNDLIFLGVFGKRLLDSDMASEMVLANILNKEHSISGMTQSWYYSTELRFLHTHILFRLGLLAAPNNWHVARVLAMALGLGLLAFSIVLVYAVSGMKSVGFYAATLCLLPLGSWYFWQTLIGGQYIPYIFISMISVALTIVLSKQTKGGTQFIFIGLLVLLGVASGFNGVKQLMVFYAPFVLASIIMIIYCIRKDGELPGFLLKNRREFRVVLFSAVAAFSSFLGFVVNSKVFSEKYHFMSFEEAKIQGGSTLEDLRNYIWSFGYAEDKLVMSINGVAALLGLLIGVLTLICAFRLFCRFDELSFEKQYLTLISVTSIGFSVFIFSYVGGGIQYFQPVVPFGLFLIVMEFETERFVLGNGKLISCFVLAAVLSVVSIGTMKNEFDKPLHDYRARKEMVDLVEWLESQEYAKGVATFWDANIITELSDGKIDMWTICNQKSDELYEWLQRVDHMNSYPEKYFYICKIKEGYSEFVERHPELELKYGDDDYVIYGN